MGAKLFIMCSNDTILIINITVTFNSGILWHSIYDIMTRYSIGHQKFWTAIGPNRDDITSTLRQSKPYDFFFKSAFPDNRLQIVMAESILCLINVSDLSNEVECLLHVSHTAVITSLTYVCAHAAMRGWIMATPPPDSYRGGLSDKHKLC